MFFEFIGQLLSSEDNLFISNSVSLRMVDQNSYIPTFLEDIVNKASLELYVYCNNDIACVADSLLTGSNLIGYLTKLSIENNQKTLSALFISTPIISFRSSYLNINWRNSNQPVVLIVDIYSENYNKNVTFNILNAKNYTKALSSASQYNQTATITYFPNPGEYPIFE